MFNLPFLHFLKLDWNLFGLLRLLSIFLLLAVFLLLSIFLLLSLFLLLSIFLLLTIFLLLSLFLLLSIFLLLTIFLLLFLLLSIFLLLTIFLPSSPECVSSDPESCNDLILNALPDSQVEGAGWMGRGMMYWRDVEKKEKEKQGKELRINYMIDSIKHELCQTVSSTAIKTFWGEFRADLKKMVEKSDLSHDAFVKLSNPDVFIQW